MAGARQYSYSSSVYKRSYDLLCLHIAAAMVLFEVVGEAGCLAVTISSISLQLVASTEAEHRQVKNRG